MNNSFLTSRPLDLTSAVRVNSRFTPQCTNRSTRNENSVIRPMHLIIASTLHQFLKGFNGVLRHLRVRTAKVREVDSPIQFVDRVGDANDRDVLRNRSARSSGGLRHSSGGLPAIGDYGGNVGVIASKLGIEFVARFKGERTMENERVVQRQSTDFMSQIKSSPHVHAHSGMEWTGIAQERDSTMTARMQLLNRDRG